MDKEKLLILDGNSLMFRSFYALPELTNAEGIHTNAIYGFLSMLFKMKEEIKPDYIVCAFDKKAPTFRHKEYSEYKAGRKKMPPELSEQMPIIKEVLNKLAIDIFEIEGFEADDLIGTLSVFSEGKGIEVYIVTGDRDALQLATDNVKVIINKKGMTQTEVYDEKRMIEELGVTPKQFIDVKGLMGDTSDNIPGVPGVGEKTAYKLIKEYGSIENVLMNIENISGKKLKENLTNFSEQAIFSKKLATIITEVPIEIDMDSIRSKENFDIEGLRTLFIKLQFKSFLDKLPRGHEEEIQCNYKEIADVEELKKFYKLFKETIFVLFKIENETVYSKCNLKDIYIHCNNENFFIPVDKLMEENREKTIEILKDIMENLNIKKISHGVKSAYTALRKLGIELKGLASDTEIQAYLIDSSKGEYKLEDILEQYLFKSVKGEEIEDNIKKVILLEKLNDVFHEKIEELNMNELLYKVEQPLIEVLASMETLGFKVNREILNGLGEKFSLEIDELKRDIYELSQEEFNINSPKQLGKILFEKLDLPVVKKTKTGYSTNAEVLEKLLDKHPIIEKIMNYRQITKLYSTYVEGLKNVIDEDGKIHSSFNQTVTTTGRLSSTEPNLQNIPIKYEMGREIRKVFVPENEECVILSADYSQIELRVLAHIAGDENMINAFKHHSDIHTKTASEVFGVPIDQVTSLMRSRAKAVNFGIVYGISDFSLSQDIKVSKKEAKQYIDTYFERYPKVKEYLDNIIEKGKENSYVETILNRRRFIPEINSSNKIVKSFGERLAMNTPIQGSAADIIKMAMVNVYKKLNEKALKSSLILQVHDELILNVYKDELEQVKSMIKDEMENVVKLSVPLEVDINVGENWYGAK
ncbi:DNA polymerase I [Haloimpatiens lingqiaonensis]|uniref:DNA polymerase I n=1 Tax=Haloimpatiens lingqiaonensis TaxID=1380675 RepID=UPI0010FF48D1|nr:DNA polymerase I [Haloimpatiens lingqiaonensis]